MIETNFCFLDDLPSYECDPDKESIKLAEHHVVLWSKKTPSGKDLKLDIVRKNGIKLHCKINNIDRFLSSDGFCASGLESKKFLKYRDQLPNGYFMNYSKTSRTIGGHVIYPGVLENKIQTINQAKGTRQNIGDRPDLTLECIKRYYEKDKRVNPILSSLQNVSYFFDLFINFKGYIDYFLLQDYVDDNYNVKFFLPFDGNFENYKALPDDIEKLKILTNQNVEKTLLRNQRIFNFCKANNIEVKK